MKTIKILARLIVAIFFIFTCSGQVVKTNDSIVKNDLTELNLIGKVKTLLEVKVKTADIFGEIQKEDTILTLDSLLFNIKGSKVKETSYDFKNSKYYKATFKYDIKGNLIEENRYDYFGGLLYNYYSKYDGSGNRIEENWCNAEGNSIKKYTFKYDEKGNKIEWMNWEDNIKIKYIYDNEGNSIENYFYQPDGSISSKHICKYNDKGNLIEDNTYDSEDSLDFKVTIKYDDKGNWLEWSNDQYYKSGGSMSWGGIFKYDSKDNKIEESHFTNIFYNGKNNIGKERISTYKYVYDDTGNWVKKNEFEDDVPKNITKRKITYY